MVTKDDILHFWTLATNDTDAIYKFHNPNFSIYYIKFIMNFYKVDSEEYHRTYGEAFYNRLNEIKLLNQTTFIDNFDPEDGKTIYCMDGLLTYGVDGDQLVITAIIVHPQRIRTGIFSNFLRYIVSFEDFNSILTTDASDNMIGFLSNFLLNGKPFNNINEYDFVWTR